ncbi:hypothetical protein [Chromobacterium sp. CV08]|uniref:hypothetical protein n=1 Tax=Chromobacterium sp. CV08 TaxID=3133274 RepID=UPI003DAA44E0
MKKAIIAMIAIIAIAMGVSFYSRQDMVDCNIVVDIKQIRKVNRKARVDIADVVRKHVAVGDGREKVEQYLKACRFRWRQLPNATDKKQEVIAAYIDESSRNFLGFHDEFRVVLDFEDGVVAKAEGWIFYHVS